MEILLIGFLAFLWVMWRITSTPRDPDENEKEAKHWRDYNGEDD